MVEAKEDEYIVAAVVAVSLTQAALPRKPRVEDMVAEEEEEAEEESTPTTHYHPPSPPYPYH